MMAITELTTEARPLPEHSDRPDFLRYNANADEVLRSMLPGEGQSRLEALQAAYQTHYEGQPDPNLREQAHLILFAVAAHQWEQQKDRATDREARGALTNKLISYNHSLSEFIYHNPSGAFKDDVWDWLARASGDGDWARICVNGAAGEVAIRRLLSATDRVRGVHTGTLEQDRHGIDLIAAVDNPRLGTVHYGIDVKVRHSNHKYFDHLESRGTEVVDGQRQRLVEMNIRASDIANNCTALPTAAQQQVRELIHTTRMPVAQ